jgi:hypothetical protein
MLLPAVMAIKYLSTEYKQFFLIYLRNKQGYGSKPSLLYRCPLNVAKFRANMIGNSLDRMAMIQIKA